MQKEFYDDRREKVTDIPLAELHAFKDHPFRVKRNAELQDLADSIRAVGVLTPLLARPRPEGGYELVSGHRRKAAAMLAGLDTLPVIVREMDDETAVIMMVDGNKQRENLLPSEKARAYKMKLDAIKRKAGRPAQNAAPDNMGQLVPNSSGLRSTEIVGAESGESYKQVQRYIRLTNLTQPLLDMVDEKRIAFSPAVELSYLPEKEQTELVEAMQLMDCTPSLSQAIRMKNESKDGTLTADRIGEILCEEKPNQRERVSFKVERLREFFPKNTTAEQMERKIIKLLDDERRRQQERKQREPDIGNTR